MNKTAAGAEKKAEGQATKGAIKLPASPKGLGRAEVSPEQDAYSALLWASVEDCARNVWNDHPECWQRGMITVKAEMTYDKGAIPSQDAGTVLHRLRECLEQVITGKLNLAGFDHSSDRGSCSFRVSFKTAVQSPAEELAPAALAFIEEAKATFESLHRRSQQLTRQALMDSLQDYLTPLKGKSFGPTASRHWANMLNAFLRATGLRVTCLNKTCEKPSLVRYKLAGTGRDKHQYYTEHPDEHGKQARHGGPVSIPGLQVILAPLDLASILEEPTTS